ncbi:hypothetical protein H4S01_000912 [Coemansia sp. RSA 2610]|nr:hypothetical protein H4S01_000912 [Coemansia sp. RSA 2610]
MGNSSTTTPNTQDRRERNRIRALRRREAESPADRQRRLDVERRRAAHRRATETDEERAQRQHSGRIRGWLRRRNETGEERELRKAANRARMAEKRRADKLAGRTGCEEPGWIEAEQSGEAVRLQGAEAGSCGILDPAANCPHSLADDTLVAATQAADSTAAAAAALTVLFSRTAATSLVEPPAQQFLNPQPATAAPLGMFSTAVPATLALEPAAGPVFSQGLAVPFSTFAHAPPSLAGSVLPGHYVFPQLSAMPAVPVASVNSIHRPAALLQPTQTGHVLGTPMLAVTGTPLAQPGTELLYPRSDGHSHQPYGNPSYYYSRTQP